MLVCGHLDNVKREVGCCLCIHARSVDQSHHMHEARVEKIARVELTTDCSRMEFRCSVRVLEVTG